LLEGISTISGFIVPKLLIGSFGSSVYGLTTSISQFLGYLVILQSGIGGVVRASLYKPLAENDNGALSVVVKTADVFLKRLAYISVAYIITLALVLPFIAKNNSLDYVFTATLVIIIGIGTFSQYYFGITYQLLLHASQKSYIFYILQMVFLTLKIILMVILIKLGAGIHTVTLVSSILFLLRPLIINIYVKRKYNINRKCKPDSTLLKQRWAGVGHTIAYFIHSKTDVFLLTIFLGVKEVAVYSIYAMITNGLTTLISTLSSSVQSAFGNMIAKDENGLLVRNFKSYECFSHIITVVLYSCAAILIIPFVQIYAGGFTDTEYIRPLAAYIILSAECIFCLRQPYHSVIISAGHYKQTRTGGFIEAGLNVVLSLILVRYWGIAGVAIGTLIAMIYRTIDYFFYLKKSIICFKISSYFKRFILSIINIAIISAIFFLFDIKASNYFIWVGVALIVFVTSLFVTLGINYIFYKDELLNIMSIFKNVFKKKNRGKSNQTGG
jgi:O-antigen/teichoic acid export membrane protein